MAPSPRPWSFLPRLWLAIAALATLAGLAHADMTAINPKYLDKIQELYPGLVTPHSNGKGYFVRGWYVIQRDAADQPTLPDPARYVMFLPLSGDYKPGNNGGPGTWGGGQLIRLEWNWMWDRHWEPALLSDLRDTISNRDLVYGSQEAGFQALLADLDPDGALGLGGAKPPVANTTIVPREGSGSHFLINGVLSSEDRANMVRAARERPGEDPQGFSPINPILQQRAPSNDVWFYIQAIARMEKYGEVEPGMLEQTRALLRFLTNRLYVPKDRAMQAGGRTGKGWRIYVDWTQCRYSVLSAAALGTPNAVVNRLKRTSTPIPAHLLWLCDDDDVIPVDILDVARAGIEVLADMGPAREPDQERVVSTLVQVATGRTDFGGAAGVGVPAEFLPRCDAVGRLAFDTLVKLAAAPATLGGDDPGAGFRPRLLSQFWTGNDAARKVVVEAMVRTGLGTVAEAHTVVDSLFQASDFDAAIYPQREPAVSALKRLPTGPMPPEVRAAYQAEVEQRIQKMQESVKDGSAGRGNTLFLAAWGA